MRGNEPNPRHLQLDLHELVLPNNLLSGEVLSSDEEAAEEELEGQPYRIATTCGICKTPVRIFVVASDAGIRNFQDLLLHNLQLLCVTCGKNSRHG